MLNQYTNTAFSAKTLKAVLKYVDTGGFVWLRDGRPAGTKTKRGYIQISVFGTLYLAHRLVWLWHTGTWPSSTIDHINGDKTDNRISNLRLATSAEQMQNRARPQKNKTGAIGVQFDNSRNKFVAAIGVGGEKHHLGRFAAVEDAQRAYADAKKVLHVFHPTVVERVANT